MQLLISHNKQVTVKTKDKLPMSMDSRFQALQTMSNQLEQFSESKDIPAKYGSMIDFADTSFTISHSYSIPIRKNKNQRRPLNDISNGTSSPNPKNASETISIKNTYIKQDTFVIQKAQNPTSSTDPC